MCFSLTSRPLENFPEPLTTLARNGVTVIQRVSAAETLLGLKTIYQIGGIPFIRLNTEGLHPRQRASEGFSISR